MSIKKLNKQIKEKESEIDELNQQKDQKNKLFNDKIEKCQNEIENVKFYNTMAQKNPSLLLPVASEKIGNKIYEGNKHNVAKFVSILAILIATNLLKLFANALNFN